MSRTALAFKSREDVLATRTKPTLYVEAPREMRARLRELDDASLLLAFLAGSDPAFTELHIRYSGKLLVYVYRMTGDVELAEDLVQEAFVNVYRSAWRYDKTRRFSSWIYTIAGNLAKNELRNRKRNRIILFQQMRSADEEDERPLQFEDSKSAPDEMMRKRHLRQIVDETLAKLPPLQRQAFILRELEGKTYAEMAVICECGAETIKSRLYRARLSFAALIEPNLD